MSLGAEVRAVSPAASLLVLAAWAAFAACTPQVMSPRPLEVSNGTTLHVSIVVNGKPVRTFTPGSQGAIAVSELPPQPWTIEARSPSGRVLTSMTVRSDDVDETTAPDGSKQYRGAAARVDLSCGRLDVWSGPPLLGPAPGPGRTGDCDP